MIKKSVWPVIGDKKVIGTVIEYRVLGVLVYKKELILPQSFGIEDYQWQVRF